LSIAWREVEALLISEIPEFAETVREHRQDWPDLPIEYLLIGQLYSFVVATLKNEPNSARREIARRVYAVVERVLVDGDTAVRDCFSIEMVEPFTISHNPQIESMMGPAALQDLEVKRVWSRRYAAMSGAILAEKAKLGCDVFSGVGIGTDTARVIANSSLWTTLSQVERGNTYRSLRKHWIDLRGLHDSKIESGLEITGTREEEFVVLAADSLAESS